MSSILVVEDEFDLRETLTMFLTIQGFEVEATALTKEALELVRERTFDCIMLDIMLPDGSGVDVLEAIRADEELRDSKVIMMSALRPENPTAALQGTPFLQKPFSFGDLQEVLDELGVSAN